MTWANFYLFCFLVGFLWSVLTLLIGHVHLHLPFHHGAVGHGVSHAGRGIHHGALAHAEAQESAVPERMRGVSISPLNLGTIAAFLAWFGGAGYLLAAYSALWFFWCLGLSILCGLAGASIVFWFLAKVLTGQESDLNPADYRMTGVLGRVSSSIREGGTGEIIYSQEGTRRTCGARSEDGKPIPKGIEVLITRYEKGIAFVRRWDEFSQSDCP
jgi:membrane protein implicated in regulation of membrane protease activity